MLCIDENTECTLSEVPEMSVEPVSFAIDHSSPSGYEEAKREIIPPVTSVTVNKIVSIFFSDNFFVKSVCGNAVFVSCVAKFSFSLVPSISGRDSYMNTSTAAVISPSTSPIARCIGCIVFTNVINGSSVMPEIFVSTDTLNAPN